MSIAFIVQHVTQTCWRYVLMAIANIITLENQGGMYTHTHTHTHIHTLIHIKRT